MTLRENFMKFLKKNILERENSAEKDGSTILIPTKNSKQYNIQRVMDARRRFGTYKTISERWKKMVSDF